MIHNQKIIIRGGGDIATGVAQKFYRAGFAVIILETAAPTAIRRTVALCEAVYDGTKQVEDTICQKIESPSQIESCIKAKTIPLLIDPAAETISTINPTAVIDAILAKRNLGTNKNMAPITIALGPGFTAGKDVHIVIETQRGHDLGRLIFKGEALPNTGIPAEIEGKGSIRVLRAPGPGTVKCQQQIGAIVQKGETIFTVENHPVNAPFEGLLRGLLRDGTKVTKGAKTADIDPRQNTDVTTISDKARTLGGAALEAYLYLQNGVLRPPGY
jgi:xanthine dehydrogenase accessory factor